MSRHDALTLRPRFDRDEVQHLLDHAAERRRVGDDDLGAGAAQAEPLDDQRACGCGVPMMLPICLTLSLVSSGASCFRQRGAGRLRQRVRGRCARAAIVAAAASGVDFVDRLVALAGDVLGGSCSVLSAATVACTTLCWLRRCRGTW